MIVLRNKRDRHRQISENFKGYELTCRCGRCHISIIDERLLEHLEILRRVWGLGLSPSSAYRCQEHNAKTGGSAPFSRHCSGQAVDIPLPDDPNQHSTFISICEAVFPFTYHTATFVHMDVRDDHSSSK